METSTGWSRTQLSGLYSMYLFVYSLFGVVTGRLSDRMGPRRVITVGGVLFAIGWASLAIGREFWHAAIGFGVVAAIGMSASFVPCSATVIKWFSARRGTALSIAISGAGLGGLIFPPLASWMMTTIGWRPTLVFLSALVGISLVWAARWMSPSPEAMGISIDGELHRRPGRAARQTTQGTLSEEQRSHSLGEALRTGSFWIIAGLFTCSWMTVFVPVVHLAPFVTSIGGSATQASVALSAIGLGGLLGRVLSGPAADRIGETPMLIVMLVVEVGAYLTFAISDDLRLIMVAAVAFGAAYGATVTLFSSVVGARFGRLHAGSIVGAVFIGAATSSAIGPFLAGILFDRTGGYRLIFSIGAAANTAAMVLAFALHIAIVRNRSIRPRSEPLKAP